MKDADSAVRLDDLFANTLGEKVPMQCETHGDYIGREKCPVCPACAEIEDQNKFRESQRQQHLEHIAKRWEYCGMPRKFCGVTMGDWKATTVDQQRAKNRAGAFISGDISRMLLIGNCGTGKTMLAAGVIGEMAARVECKPVYITATRLIRSIRDTWRNKETGEQEKMDEYINADVLVVDELGAGRCSEDDKLILSEILCDRYSADMPTLLISNLTGDQIKASVLDDRAIDRMREGGEVVVMKWESMRGK